MGQKTNRIEIANSAHEFSAYTVYFWPKLGQQAAQVDNDVDNDAQDEPGKCVKTKDRAD